MDSKHPDSAADMVEALTHAYSNLVAVLGAAAAGAGFPPEVAAELIEKLDDMNHSATDSSPSATILSEHLALTASTLRKSTPVERSASHRAPARSAETIRMEGRLSLLQQLVIAQSIALYGLAEWLVVQPGMRRETMHAFSMVLATAPVVLKHTGFEDLSNLLAGQASKLSGQLRNLP
jgi:hypothetical protein